MNQVCERIICVDREPQEPWKLFFGDTGHFLRVDRVDYPVFRNLYEKAFADFWTWKVVDFKDDIIGWQKLPENAQSKFLKNNAYQTLMDGGVVNIYNYLAMIASNTELALLYNYIAQNESIHAGSYSYGLSQMFGSQAKEKIDIVYIDKVVQERLANEIDYSEELIEKIHKHAPIDDEYKRSLLKVISATYILEHIKFPFSFFTTWRINEGYGNAIQGFSMLLKLIAEDELGTHVPSNLNVLKILKREERQEFKYLFDSGWFEEFFIGYAKEVAKAEIKWCEYLFEDGPIDGFTKEMGIHFIKVYTDKAVTRLGYSPIFKEQSSDVIDWYESYRKINLQNTAQQEVSNVSYQKGTVRNDILTQKDSIFNNQDDLNDFKVFVS